MYEWLPWVAGILDQVPREPAGVGLARDAVRQGGPLTNEVRDTLRRLYGARAAGVLRAEAFERCEYGRRADEAELRRLFPFF